MLLKRSTPCLHLFKLFDIVALHYRQQYALNNIGSHLHTSHDYYAQAIAALTYQSKRISPASKFTLAAQANGIYAGAIATNLLLHQHTDSLHYLHEAFTFAERSKAFLLYEALQEAEALQVAGIPAELLQREYDLRVDIAYQDKRKQEKLGQGLSETDTTVLAISSQLFELNQQFNALKKQFETDYPQYYKAKYDLSAASIVEVQRDLLQADQTLLEYLVGDSSTFAFVVQKDRLEVLELKITKDSLER